ncbi:WYL domain-containing protein [Cellulosimicrobium funkei]|uniref:helix-turn-helix transcriptional regulator n=1 Tax=Cellulosimicrobium funkei TaxID=264251 RepID=UPI00203F6C1E|nr:WYL domain-containing protein [Cellulosimicrobium funkei]MCM3536205.1 WYL domain-containing protein [Cellulosimicrobium funkei]
MNRTERLYALAEELRRAGRTGTTGPRLAAALEVSERTIKRDVAALQQAGLTIWAQAGPGGGYVLDPSASLPPVNFTPGQAVAVAVALATLPPGSPFAVDALAARGKVWDALGAGDRARAEALAARVWVRHAVPDPDRPDAVPPASPPDAVPPAAGPPAAPADAVPSDAVPSDAVPPAAVHPGESHGDTTAPGRGDVVGRARTHLGVLRAVEQSIAGGRVLAIRYRDGRGATSTRRVEPVLLAHTDGRWYLVAWCRTREAIRWLRLSRVERADLTAEAYDPRPVADVGEPPPGSAAVYRPDPA